MLTALDHLIVLRVLNKHLKVRQAVPNRVLRIVEERDCILRAAARTLASQRTRVAGLLIPRTTVQISQGITQSSTNLGSVLMLSKDSSDPMVRLSIQGHTPLVLLGRQRSFQQLNWVDLANCEGARTAAGEPLSLEHPHLAISTSTAGTNQPS